jgi:hypothetical protein
MNLAWTTSIPIPSLLLIPITRVFGIFASFNLLSLLAPMTAAWTTYLLVHRATRRWWPSLAAGLVFALSPLETTQLAMGHVNLSLTALVPLAAYLVVRQLEGSLRPRTFVLLLGFVLASEFGISTEVFATTTLFGSIALLLLYVFDRGGRPAIQRCAALVVVGYLMAGILASPMLVAAFARPHPPGVASSAGSATPISGVRTVVPHARSLADRFLHPGSQSSLSAAVLVGVPLLAVLLHLAWRKRREPVLRALAATALVALICSAGIVVVGSTELPSPWALATHLPFLRLVRPQRLTMFAWLIAAVGVGVWLAEGKRSWRRWGAAGLVLASMLPAIWWGGWTSVIPTSPLVVAANRYLSYGQNVAVVAGPPPGSLQLEDLAYPTVWQVESNFSFRLANAYVGSFGPTLPIAVRRFVLKQPLLPGQAAEVVAWLRRTGVGAVMVMRPTPEAVAGIGSLLGTEPVRVGGVVLFTVGESG